MSFRSPGRSPMSSLSQPHRCHDFTSRAIASEASRTLASATSPPSATAWATQWPRWSSSSPSATDCRALVAAATWVRMSMQYLSSSTIFCKPRTWPSIRRSRLRYSPLLGAYPYMVPPRRANSLPYPGRVYSCQVVRVAVTLVTGRAGWRRPGCSAHHPQHRAAAGAGEADDERRGEDQEDDVQPRRVVPRNPARGDLRGFPVRYQPEPTEHQLDHVPGRHHRGEEGA